MRHKTTKPTTLPIGTISEGTLRPEDLIPALLDALQGIRLSREDRTKVREIARMVDQYDADNDEPQTILGEIIDADTYGGFADDLQTIAEGYAPPYAYVGTLDGDGACFGVWPTIPEDRDEDVTRVDAGGAWYRPGKVSTPYVLEVNDHGNATLYERRGRQWREVWSVV